MSFRRRLALCCAAAVAVVAVLGSGAAYWIVDRTLHGQIDDDLRQRAVRAEVSAPPPDTDVLLSQRPPVFTAFIGEGVPTDAVSPLSPPAGAAAVSEVANGRRAAYFSDQRVHGGDVRVYTARSGNGVAVVVARPLGEVEHSLFVLRWALGILALIGIGLAVLFSRLATRAAVKPVADLTATAEHVATTRDLSQRIEAQGEDELSRLATAFNTMLGELEDSQRAQRRLVADASHELRTPLTSLRTNLEVMARNGLDDGDRERLRHDVVAQLEEMTGLVGDLVELARDEEPEPPPLEDVRFDELVQAAVERARRHAPHVAFATELEPVLVSAVPARLDRAVANLLDNAAKYSATVDVRLADGELTVRDHGPGIDPEDRAHVFDRFFRADEARGRPGSGLGLAIVRQVAESHGGSVAAEAAEGGGALLRLRLPASQPIPRFG
jgi:two-component system, OmpR family, sensor histidine kinase MprB